MAERPTITIPDSEPPADLVIEDETVGDGEEAVVGKRVYVHYAGVAWSNGQEFDAAGTAATCSIFVLAHAR